MMDAVPTSRRVVLLVAVAAVACGHPPTTRATVAPLPAAANADSILVRNADTLYRAAMMSGVPGRQDYDVERAIALLEEYIGRYPSASNRQSAAERLALLHEIRSLRLELQTLKDIDMGRRP